MHSELKAMGCPEDCVEKCASLGVSAYEVLGISAVDWLALVKKFMDNLPMFISIIQAIIDALPKKPV